MNLDLAVATKFLQEFARPFPTRDWLGIAIIGLLVFAGGAAIAAQLFWGAQTGSIIAASADVPRAPIPVSRDAIAKVVEIYQSRATNYQNKAFPSVTLSDPRPRPSGR